MHIVEKQRFVIILLCPFFTSTANYFINGIPLPFYRLGNIINYPIMPNILCKRFLLHHFLFKKNFSISVGDILANEHVNFLVLGKGIDGLANSFLIFISAFNSLKAFLVFFSLSLNSLMFLFKL